MADDASVSQTCLKLTMDVVESTRDFELLEEYVDQAYTSQYDRSADETFRECNHCGGWEDHFDECPVPVAEERLNREGE